MKIAYISDLEEYSGYLPDDFPHLRADVSWVKTLNLCHFPFSYAVHHIDELEAFDMVIINYPKAKDGYMTTYVPLIMSMLNKPKKGLIQHGGYDFFMEWKAETQSAFIENVRNSDFFIITNDVDRQVFGLVAGDVPILYLATDLDDAFVQEFKSEKKQDAVMLSGNMTQWYGGTFSLLVAEKFGVPITVPWMGKHHDDERDFVPGMVGVPVNYLPYQRWKEWLNILSQHKYAVNMMPVAACGSFTVACAALGIPCIGREHITAQRVCFPDLCVDNTFDGIDEKIKYIKENYDLISKKAREAFLKHFERNVVKKQFYDQLEKLK